MRNKIKKITYISIILTILVVIFLIAGMIININRMYSEYKKQAISFRAKVSEQNDYNELVDNYEEASSSIGKTVEEVKNEEDKEDKEVNSEEDKTKDKTEDQSETNIVEEKKETLPIVIPDPTFIKPVEGEVIKEYSKEKLVYSETLKEWTTHIGIDIEADLATVVKAASEGTVKSIKNDPRYGITVIIEHTNGYETRYSNLLTAEFVTIGENVTRGQTIGTVGSTASFEILDKSHLHFEILKDNEYLDPTSYIK